MLRNTDGTPYNLAGSLQQFDPENVEFNLFNLWDQEAINIGGIPVYYYEVMIQSNTVDPLFWEDRGKIFSNNPICIIAYYDPTPTQNAMTVFGIDSPDEIMLNFNYSNVIAKIGHPPRIGSRIFTPHKRENWEVIQNFSEEYKLWGHLRMQTMCRRFQESTTVGEGKVTQKTPNFKID